MQRKRIYADKPVEQSLHLNAPVNDYDIIRQNAMNAANSADFDTSEQQLFFGYLRALDLSQRNGSFINYRTQFQQEVSDLIQRSNERNQLNAGSGLSVSALLNPKNLRSRHRVSSGERKATGKRLYKSTQSKDTMRSTLYKKGGGVFDGLTGHFNSIFNPKPSRSRDFANKVCDISDIFMPR
jgi:hypothetical protein